MGGNEVLITTPYVQWFRTCSVIVYSLVNLLMVDVLYELQVETKDKEVELPG